MGDNFGISPHDLGAPKKFSNWREGQFEALMNGAESEKRFVAYAAPTGTGKTLLSVSHALLSNARVVILTRTKSLQTQLLGDFESIGLIDVKGQNSYQCIAGPDFGIQEPITVDEGPCMGGMHCPMKHDGRCLYYGAVARASKARLVSTNYDFWMASNKYGDGIGDFDLLVCDEAHEVRDALSSFLTVVLDSSPLQRFLGVNLPTGIDTIDEWKRWARHNAEAAQNRIESMKTKMKREKEGGQKANRADVYRMKMLKQLHRDLTSLAGAVGEWVIEWIVADKRISFTPLWPADYAESTLYLNTPKVIFLSATLTRETIRELGVKDYDFFEVPSTFPADTRPVYYVPTVGLSYKSTESDMRYWLGRLDEIIDGRLDRKGLIHSVSYRLTKMILENSRHKALMLTHDPKTARSTVERFRQMKAPAVLVSPSMTTGVDFPEEDIAYVIVSKLPFPDMRSKVLKARMEVDKVYLDNQVAQTVVQACGRHHRSEDSVTESFIIDDNWARFIKYRRALFPTWFLSACKTVMHVPEAPMLAARGAHELA